MFYVLKKGVCSQKTAFISNLAFYVIGEESVNSFFDFINEKIYSLDSEIQIHLFSELNKLLQDSNSEIAKFIKEKHANYLIVIIVKLIIEDERNKVSNIGEKIIFIIIFIILIEKWSNIKLI